MFRTLSRYLMATAAAGTFAVTAISANPAPLRAAEGSGSEAFERGDSAAALAELSQAAQAGDPRAQFYLGKIYSEAESELADTGEALYWLGCAAASESAISSSALGLLQSLRDGLNGVAPAARSCPQRDPALPAFDLGNVTVDLPEVGTFNAVRQSTSGRRSRVEKSIVTKIREDDWGSIFMLPGEATIEVGHRAARAVGAKKVAYYVDETRQPGNDMGYLLIVFLSWLLLFKAVIIVVSIANKFGPRGISIDGDQQKKMDRSLLGGRKTG